MAKTIQIDVNKVNEENGMVACGIYTDQRWVRIYMSISDYKSLVSDGFFIRDGKEKDSAGVLNTTAVYETK